MESGGEKFFVDPSDDDINQKNMKVKHSLTPNEIIQIWI